MSERAFRSLILPFALLIPAAMAADDLKSLDNRLKVVAAKFNEFRTARHNLEFVKKVEAQIEGLKVYRNEMNRRVQEAQRIIEQFGDPRWLNSAQKFELMHWHEVRAGYQAEADGASRNIEAGLLNIPTGRARDEMGHGLENAKREYISGFWDIVAAADSEEAAGRLDREAIVRDKLAIHVGDGSQEFMEELKKFMVENAIAARRPMPEPGKEVAKVAPAIRPIADIPAAPIPIKGDKYYRLVNRLLLGKSLDVINDGKNNQPHVIDTANFTGQRWKFIAAGDGYYRITNLWQGDKSLDAMNREDPKGGPILVKSGSSPSQLWKVVDVGGGFYRLTNKQQQERSLGIVLGAPNPPRPMMGSTADFNGQHWKIAD